MLPHIKILLSANVASTNNPTLGEAAPCGAASPKVAPRRAGGAGSFLAHFYTSMI